MEQWLNDISARQWLGERDCITQMLNTLQPVVAKSDKINVLAYKWVEGLRADQSALSVEAFLQEYSLSSKEGVAIMCMAEALLRIPDPDTANALLESTFADAQWDAHLKHGQSFYLNASSWGLLLTGKMLNLDASELDAPTGVLRGLAKRSSEPVIRQALKAAMHLIARQFVMGETIKQGLRKGEKLSKQGYRFSYDMLGEGARSWEQADQYFASYQGAIEAIAAQVSPSESMAERASISIKLTALHPRYEWLNREQVATQLLPRLKKLVKTAADAGVAVAIDAEEATRLDLELELFATLRLDKDFTGYDGIGFVLQAYQKRAWAVIDYVIELSKRSGQVIPVRLVKGAYWDSEIKFAQMHGLSSYPVFTNKHHSDVSYLACAMRLLEAQSHIYPQFATHNAHSIAAIQVVGEGKIYEFQRLYGMGEALYAPIVGTTPCRIYAPIGEHRDLLAYLIRRLLENGANSSFVHRAMDKEMSVDQVIEDPITAAQQELAMIDTPDHLFIQRHNSTGVDYGNRVQMQALSEALETWHKTKWKAGEGKKSHAVVNPANTRDIVGYVALADEAAIDAAANAAQQAGKAWACQSVSKRAAIAEAIADALHDARDELLALLMREAGKTIKDAIAEWREAIDFCRYYAQQAREQLQPLTLDSYTGEHNQLSYHARGVFVCISPWNFPLAIFTGQIVAALVTGNTVLAKPAEQTPLIAARAVALMHQAGVPKDALHVLCGEGDVGAALVNHSAVSGVCFTGSHGVAKHIQRALAERDGAIIPLIAETGGLNAMIADSSALPEQLCDDVIQSAFGAAGQRCSALRLLFLPRSTADAQLALLKGALESLRVGDPTDMATDIGPVIDAQALERLQNHSDSLAQIAKPCGKAPLSEACAHGHFIAPQIWELEDASQLAEEFFGPILHVVRYDPAQLEQVIAQINQSGYGLTFGLHTRIQSRYADLAQQIHAGNIYVNRNMVGAIVGVQPFGGEGLSGTGPKAGGPNYLHAFVTERTTSINTAAIGGNVELLMGV